MDLHERALERLCRICGQRCVKWPQSLKNHRGLDKVKHQEKILTTYNINIVNDVDEIHPKYICHSCVAAFGKRNGTTRPIIGWTEHEADPCKACDLIQNSIARRKRKPATVGVERRRQREEDERERCDVEKACDVLLGSKRSPTKKMQRLATVVVKSMMVDEMVEMPTGGSKLFLQKVIKPKVATHEASSRTIRERVRKLNATIRLISSPDGDDEEAAIQQLAALLKGKTKAQLKQLLKTEGLINIKIPPGHELLMKSQMGWTWSEMRKLKSWLAAYKVRMVCEGRSRSMRKDLLGDTVEADMLPFLFKEGDVTETRLAPMAFIPDLQGHIMDTLDEMERLDMLVWDGIPNDEIWVKIGGDKGGGTTKCYYQIANTTKTNSIKNTTAFCIYAADETTVNLHTALDQYKQQITDLQKTTWSGKRIVLWLIGDYEFERKLLGLQGASATCPCIYCHQTKDNLDSDSDAQLRDLDTILDDYRRVESASFSTKSKQANHSVSHQPFFDIPLDRVCPPALHLNLGIWGKCYSNLEKELEELGQLIAEEKAQENQPTTSTSIPTPFLEHIQVTKQILKEVGSKETKSEEYRQQALELEYSLMNQGLVNGPVPSKEQMQEIEDLHKQSNALANEAQKIKHAHKLDHMSNPLIQRLDKALQTFKVRRQSYHSRSFVGNHVAKCLKVENYTTLLAEVVKATKDLTDNEDLHDHASRIQVGYMILFEKFAACYDVYSSCDTLTQVQIDQLESNINSLVEYYTTRFRFSFTPKFHILLKHVIPFIRRTGFALGKMSEQGGEMLHHQCNILGRNLEGVKNVQSNPEVTHLKAIMEEHHISVHPAMRTPNPMAAEI